MVCGEGDGLHEGFYLFIWQLDLEDLQCLLKSSVNCAHSHRPLSSL